MVLGYKCGLIPCGGLQWVAEVVVKPRVKGGDANLMIFVAIDALKEKEGSNKSSISQYIESTYGDLPAGPPNLLLDNLNKTKEAGELAMVKNNYPRPDPSLDSWAGSGAPRGVGSAIEQRRRVGRRVREVEQGNKEEGGGNEQEEEETEEISSFHISHSLSLSLSLLRLLFLLFIAAALLLVTWKVLWILGLEAVPGGAPRGVGGAIEQRRCVGRRVREVEQGNEEEGGGDEQEEEETEEISSFHISHSLTNRDPIKEYQTHFEKPLICAGQLSPGQQGGCFISRLKDNLKVDVQACKPTTLLAAISPARLYKGINQSMKQAASTDSKRTNPNPLNPNSSALLIKRLPPAELKRKTSKRILLKLQ
ncbi:hypothetical protein RJ640_014009 [Escallonia rubra]|uniref:H15 domain-containing protein n=1 Tax=Escallonia rubra TaxID=112253 RepID=A0AA88RVH4_9ASTE|nr:hypothetical protein RJ640_014009 [Escallonia rubra]